MKFATQDRKIEKNLIKSFFNYLIKQLNHLSYLLEKKLKRRVWNMIFA